MLCRHASTVALALALAACDPAEPGSDEVVADDDDTPSEEEPPPNADPTAEVAATHELAEAIQNEGETSASIAAEAVFLASQTAATGQVVTTGTLTQDGAAFTWSAEPADRMVVEFGDGTTVELWVEDIAGDPSSATAFLDGEHRLVYRVAVADRLDMEFASVRDDGAITASADGSYVHEGLTYDVALDLAGTYEFEVDTTGSYFRDDHRTTGSIAAPGFELDVDETWSFELVTSGNDSAQAAQRTIASSLQLGDEVYDWVDVVLKKNFRDGRPSELDTYWAADGEILRNGESFGAYRLGSTSTLDFVTVVVDLPDGPLELERYTAN